MSKPQWLREAEAEHGMRVRAGTETQEQAADAIAGLIIANHRDYLAGIASKAVGDWVRKHEPTDLFQDDLFPLLPAYLHVAVDRPFKVADMTLHELDNAAHVLNNQVRNTMRGARKRKKVFDHFYNTVRPVLEANPGMTVAAATVTLAAKAAA